MRKRFVLIVSNDMRKGDRDLMWEWVMRWKNEKDIWCEIE